MTRDKQNAVPLGIKFCQEVWEEPAEVCFNLLEQSLTNFDVESDWQTKM